MAWNVVGDDWDAGMRPNDEDVENSLTPQGKARGSTVMLHPSARLSQEAADRDYTKVALARIRETPLFRGVVVFEDGRMQEEEYHNWTAKEELDKQAKAFYSWLNPAQRSVIRLLANWQALALLVVVTGHTSRQY